MRALTLWQVIVRLAVIAQSVTRSSLLATACSGGGALGQHWQHQVLQVVECARVFVCSSFVQEEVWHNAARGSCGVTAGQAAVGEWQLWVLHELLEASWDLVCGWQVCSSLPESGSASNKHQ